MRKGPPTGATRPHLQLTGEDGNIFFIVGRARRALKDAGLSRDVVDRFTREVAATRSYADALAVVDEWLETW